MVFRAVSAEINGGIDMIKLKHIYKSYSLGDEQVDVLHNINLHVKPKEFVSILGPVSYTHLLDTSLLSMKSVVSKRTGYPCG